jgi:tRNA dimethylallyltransferase
MTESVPLLIAVMGATASGKTDLAERIADRFEAALINADAFQVYLGMDVGTAKPDHRDQYELIDIKDPDESYGVGEFTQLAVALLERFFSESRNVVVVGGTGLYVRALMEEYQTMQAAPDRSVRDELNRRLEADGLESLVAELRARDPGTADRTDLRNPVRVIRAIERLALPKAEAVRLPNFRRSKLAIDPDSDVLDARIQQRAVQMVQNGWVREVESLRNAGYVREDFGFRAIGYRQMWDHLEGRVELEDAIATTIAETKRYAKRQRTWLRSEPNLCVLKVEDLSRPVADLVTSALI